MNNKDTILKFFDNELSPKEEDELFENLNFNQDLRSDFEATQNLFESFEPILNSFEPSDELTNSVLGNIKHPRSNKFYFDFNLSNFALAIFFAFVFGNSTFNEKLQNKSLFESIDNRVSDAPNIRNSRRNKQMQNRDNKANSTETNKQFNYEIQLKPSINTFSNETIIDRENNSICLIPSIITNSNFMVDNSILWNLPVQIVNLEIEGINQTNWAIELNGASNYSLFPKLDKSRKDNWGLTILYHAYDNVSLGFEYCMDNFTVKIPDAETNNFNKSVKQEASYSGVIKFESEVNEKINQFFKISLGANSWGIIAKAGIGVSYELSEHFSAGLSLKYSNLFYLQSNRLPEAALMSDSRNIGISYDLIYKF
jgi:hypothetical protein